MLRKYLSFSRVNASETCVSPMFLTTSIRFKSSSLPTKRTPKLLTQSAQKKKHEQKTAPAATATSTPSSPQNAENPSKTLKLSLDQIKLLSTTFLQLGGTYKARGQGSDFFRGTAMIRISEKLDVFRTQILASLMTKTPAETAAKPVSYSVHELNQLVLHFNDTSSILKRILDFAKEHNHHHPQETSSSPKTIVSENPPSEPKGNIKKK